VKGHVAVGILVDRFRPRNQAVFVLVTSVIALAFTIFLTWGLFDHAMYNQRIGWTTGYLKIPRHPFIYLAAVSMALTCVVLIRDLLKAVITLRKGFRHILQLFSGGCAPVHLDGLHRLSLGHQRAPV
jgi:TRAP-type C4-dicarboxylate transport system permease small subunit